MCPWLVDGGDAARDGDGPDDDAVRAMTLVLRIERETRPDAQRSGAGPSRPARTALLEAAAAAALAACLDPRAGPGGDWYDAFAAWAGAGRIRKLARRARTSHWRAVGDVEGVTVEREGAEVRALVPGPVDDVVHEVRRLQIGGTDLPADDPGPVATGRPVIWLNPGVDQSTGKAAAQVGHASMILAVTLDAAGHDPRTALDAAVRTADRADWDRWVALLERDGSGRQAWEDQGVVPVRDAGFTEVAPGTVTCVAQAGPP